MAMETYFVSAQGKTSEFEVKAQLIQETGGVLFFFDQSQSVVLALPTSRLRSVRHETVKDPGTVIAKATSTTLEN